MDPVDALARTYDALDRLLRSLGPGDLDRPSPCEGWTVRDVLNHLFGAIDAFTVAAREGTPPQAPSGDDRVGNDPAAAFPMLRDDSLTAWGTPGAAERPTGVIPDVALVELQLADVALHTWDVATAAGLDADLPPDVVDHLLAKLEGEWAEIGRRMGAFGPPCDPPDEASAVERLAAVAGRQP